MHATRPAMAGTPAGHRQPAARNDPLGPCPVEAAGMGAAAGRSAAARRTMSGVGSTAMERRGEDRPGPDRVGRSWGRVPALQPQQVLALVRRATGPEYTGGRV